MENNDSNMKPQQTGGLKLMTIFIAVLALHVVVIGGITIYHLMSGSGDADLAANDKTHKDSSSITDVSTPDAVQADKTAPTPPTQVAVIPANSPIPANDANVSEITSPAPAPVSTPAVALAQSTRVTTPVPAPKTQTAAPAIGNEQVSSTTPSGPIPANLMPPPEPTTVLAPTMPVAHEPGASAMTAPAGPVHMPPAVTSAPARETVRGPAREIAHARMHEHAHEQIYVVKITDSYKKIAHSHHVTVAQLKEANHIKGNVLHTGQKLFIPSNKTMVATNDYTASTALDAAPRSVLSEAPTGSNALLTSESSTLVTTAPHRHLYTVVKGDTLAKIAHRFKTTSAAIVAANGLSKSGKLSVGKKLRIPSQDSRSARNNVPVATPQPNQDETKSNAPSGELANFSL